MIRTEVYKIPMFLVCYIAYGDTDDLTEHEIEAANRFMSENGVVDIIRTSDKYFGNWHDVTGIEACEIVEALCTQR